jgi:hypothetical protein
MPRGQGAGRKKLAVCQVVAEGGSRGQLVSEERLDRGRGRVSATGWVAARSPDGESVGAGAGRGQRELAERESRLTGPPHRDHLAKGGRLGQHDQAAVTGDVGCRRGAGWASQAATWRRCGGRSGSAEQVARRWSAPARRWRRAGRRPEPEPDAVAPVIDQAGRPVSRILGGPAGDQQPGWELPELGRA